MDVRFHCLHAVRRDARRSKHRVGDCCDTVCRVLALNPEFGVLVPGSGGLRKMRVRVPGLNIGKSGGYRLIYRAALIDQSWHVVLLAVYFKGDTADLSRDEYRRLLDASEEVFSAPIQYDWDDPPQSLPT